MVEETVHPDLLGVDRRFKDYYLRYKRTASVWHNASFVASLLQGQQPLIRQPEKLIGRLLDQMNRQGAEVDQLRENLLRIAAGRPLIWALPVASDDSDLMVTDPATGLAWTRRDSGFSSDWEDAWRYCSKLTLGGGRDSVSHRRSSNRTYAIHASGFRTGFSRGMHEASFTPALADVEDSG